MQLVRHLCDKEGKGNRRRQGDIVECVTWSLPCRDGLVWSRQCNGDAITEGSVVGTVEPPELFRGDLAEGQHVLGADPDQVCLKYGPWVGSGWLGCSGAFASVTTCDGPMSGQWETAGCVLCKSQGTDVQNQDGGGEAFPLRPQEGPSCFLPGCAGGH